MPISTQPTAHPLVQAVCPMFALSTGYNLSSRFSRSAQMRLMSVGVWWSERWRAQGQNRSLHPLATAWHCTSLGLSGVRSPWHGGFCFSSVYWYGGMFRHGFPFTGHVLHSVCVCVCTEKEMLRMNACDSAPHINTFNWLLNDIIQLRPVQ